MTCPVCPLKKFRFFGYSSERAVDRACKMVNKKKNRRIKFYSAQNLCLSEAYAMSEAKLPGLPLP